MRKEINPVAATVVILIVLAVIGVLWWKFLIAPYPDPSTMKPPGPATAPMSFGGAPSGSETESKEKSAKPPASEKKDKKPTQKGSE